MIRPVDKHLDESEIDALVSPSRQHLKDSEPLSEQTLGEARRHLESCEYCDRKVQMHMRVQGEISRLGPSSGPKSECPKDVDWLHVAAGLLPETRARRLMWHAAQCGNCGPLLRNASLLLSEAATGQEEALIAQLQATRTDRQQEITSRLYRNIRPGRGADSTRSGWWAGLLLWQRYVFAAASLVVAILVGWLGQVLQTPSVQTLVAQAYTQRRTLELRIPGAAYAPMQVQRGAIRSNLDRPPSLLKAEGMIGENLQRYPNDPEWLQAKARVDLLDGNYESAIQSLQRALEAQPNSTSLLIDLASAYFQRAEATDHAIDYGSAIDCLGKALAKAPDDPVALFNRAIVSERVFLYHQAVDDWQHYLRIDPTGAWSEEARKRLSALEDKLRKHENDAAEPMLSPIEFVNKISLSDEATWATVDSRVEDYLDLATQSWLELAYPANSVNPDHGKKTSAERSLKILAKILTARHNESWLVDFMHSEPSEALAAAVRALARAIDANNAGNSSVGHRESLQAEHFFQKANSPVGMRRAEMEELYSLHRLFHSSECSRLASRIENSIADSHYAWIETQLRLEEFSCFDAQARMDRGDRVIREALNLATSSGYATLLLRAVGFAAVLATDEGNLATAAAWDQFGLQRYWSGIYPPMRAYQFYDDLTDQLQRAQKWHAASAIAREAVRAIAATPNRSGEGMAHFQLAISLGMAGDSTEASNEYAIALDVFSRLPSNPGIDGIKADAELQLAEAEAIQGRIGEAESRLLNAKAELPKAFNSFHTWLTYYRTQAQIARLRGDAKSLQQACTSAVAIGESGLSTILTERDRLTWNHATASCYRDLVTVKLRENDPTAALAIWEWYQGAAIRSTPPGSLPAISGVSEPQPHLPHSENIEQHLQQLNHETVLAYAELGEEVSAWIYDDRGVYWQKVPVDGGRLAHVANEFAAQCADPNSDLSTLQSNGRLLYDWLVAPFESRMESKRTLIIETNGNLATVPFQAFVEPDGSYLQSHHTLVFSPGLDYMLRLRAGIPISRNLVAVVVGNPSVSLGSSTLTPLADAAHEAEQISRLFTTSILLTGKDAAGGVITKQLERAEVFHFAGHAVSGPEGTGLEVAPDEKSAQFAFRTLLTPERIVAANPWHLQLVVLSACSTGRSGEEGLAGPEDIAAAFLQTGAPHVVATRWNIDSEATMNLMGLVYKSMLRGESVSASVRLAAQQVRDTTNRSHPYYWAAFSVFGRS